MEVFIGHVKGQDATINGYNAITLQAGSNISLTNSGSVFTINATNGSSGGGNSVAFSQALSSGIQIGTITIDGTATALYAPSGVHPTATATVSGSPAHFTTAKPNLRITALTANIAPVAQNLDGASYPGEVVSVSNNNNLFDGISFSSGSLTAMEHVQPGTNIYPAGSTRIRSDYISVTPWTTYQVNAQAADNNRITNAVCFLYESNTGYASYGTGANKELSMARSEWNTLPIQFTVPPECHYLRVIFKYDNDANVSDSSFLNKTMYATSYIAVCPISGQNTVNVYRRPTSASSGGTTITQALGRTVYRGSLDAVSGVLTSSQVSISPTTVTGGAVSATTGDFVGILASDALPAADNDTSGGVRCDRAQTVTANTQLTTADRATVSIDNTGNVKIAVNGVTTAADLETWLSANTPQVVYELAVPQTYQLDKRCLFALNGDNYVSADTGNVSVTYRTDYGVLTDEDMYFIMQGVEESTT